VCGNAVVEAGEDCDTFAPEGAECSAEEAVSPCTFSCTTATCPDDFACGGDGVCRRASGEFELIGTAVSLSGVLGAVDDVDGDGFLDMVASSPADVEMYYGAGDGTFDDALDISLRLGGLAGIGDLNGDGRVDIGAVNDVGGFIMESTEDRDLRSLALSSFQNPTGEQIRAIAVATFLPTLDQPLLLGNGEMCVSSGCDFVQTTAPIPGNYEANELASRIPVAELDTALFTYEEFAIAAPGDARVWIYELVAVDIPNEGSILAPQQRELVTFPGGSRSEPVFIDSNLDNRLDLAMLVDVMGQERVAIATQNILGGFNPPAIDVNFDTFSPMCGSSNWPLALGPITPESNVFFYIGEAGVCQFVPLVGFVRFATPSVGLPFSEAVVADFNGDGRNDAAAALGGLDGIDFFLGAGEGLFNRVSIDTNYPVSHLRVGDYDGNFIADVAFVEHADEDGEDGQDVSVIFGGVDSLSNEPVVMGRFGTIGDLEPINLVTTPSTIDAITDLGVVSQSGLDDGDWGVSIMYGDASRRMLSLAIVGEPGAASVVGSFVPADANTTGRGLAAVSGALGEATDNGMPPEFESFQITLMRDQQGAFGLREQWQIDPDTTDFAFACALYAAIDLDGDGVDELVGFHGPGRPFMQLCEADPSREDPARAMVLDTSTSGPDVISIPNGVERPESIASADIGGDGTIDVIIAFRDGGVVVYPADGRSIDTSAGVTMPSLTSARAAAPLTRPDGSLGIVALVEGGVLLFEADEDGNFTADPARIVGFDSDTPPGASALLTGDVDADGFDDIIVQRGGDVRIYRAVTLDPGASESAAN
jgi:hypothetical protein